MPMCAKTGPPLLTTYQIDSAVAFVESRVALSVIPLFLVDAE